MLNDKKKDESMTVAQAGSRGGQARAKKLSPQRRSVIAKKAAKTRWEKFYAEAGKEK